MCGYFLKLCYLVFVTFILVLVLNEFCNMECSEINHLIYYKINFFCQSYMVQLSIPGLYMFRPFSAIIIEVHVTSNRSVWRGNTTYTNKPLMHTHIYKYIDIKNSWKGQIC